MNLISQKMMNGICFRGSYCKWSEFCLRASRRKSTSSCWWSWTKRCKKTCRRSSKSVWGTWMRIRRSMEATVSTRSSRYRSQIVPEPTSYIRLYLQKARAAKSLLSSKRILQTHLRDAMRRSTNSWQTLLASRAQRGSPPTSGRIRMLLSRGRLAAITLDHSTRRNQAVPEVAHSGSWRKVTRKLTWITCLKSTTRCSSSCRMWRRRRTSWGRLNPFSRKSSSA